MSSSSSSSSPLYCLGENISFDTLIRRSSRGHNSRKATQPSHCGTCLILWVGGKSSLFLVLIGYKCCKYNGKQSASCSSIVKRSAYRGRMWGKVFGGWVEILPPSECIGTYLCTHIGGGLHTKGVCLKHRDIWCEI